jgi:hypothetical protein
LGNPSASSTGSRPRLLVLDIRATLGIEPDFARLIGDMLASRLAGVGLHEVISASDVRAMLDMKQQQQLIGCEEDEACLVELGGAVGAQYLVHGSLSRLGQRAVLNLKLLDTNLARVDGQLSDALPQEEAEIAEHVRVAAYRLLSLEAPARVEPPAPWYENPWLWTAVGVVAVGGAVSSYLLLRPPAVPEAGLGEVTLDAQ